ncbi:hypothetical protein AB0E69_13025 [Kribbella sp. NPDC026611]|uniref:hypothetical protein n=1 Tax=Kribbella sp. NPDC026611 TaxID=3154911 RepID=UPI00340DD872
MQTMQPARPASPFVEPWKASPRTTLITALVIGVIVVISAASFVVQRLWFTPDSVVSGYFAALADRDAQQAQTYGGADVPAGLISSDKYVPPSKVTIDKIDGKSDDRTAKVSFLIGDNKLSGEVKLQRKSELTWGLFRGWELTGDRPAIDITTTAPVAVQVNGQTVNAEEGDASRHLEVFPGRYVVGLADNPLIESDPVTIDAGFGDSTAELTPRIKADAKAEVDAQVKAYLKGCLTAATKPDSKCPFSINYDVTRPAWRIDKYPAMELRLADDGNVVAESTTDGQATLTGLGYGGTPVNEPSSFTLAGTVTVEQGAIKFTPQS